MMFTQYEYIISFLLYIILVVLTHSVVKICWGIFRRISTKLMENMDKGNNYSHSTVGGPNKPPNKKEDEDKIKLEQAIRNARDTEVEFKETLERNKRYDYEDQRSTTLKEAKDVAYDYKNRLKDDISDQDDKITWGKRFKYAVITIPLTLVLVVLVAVLYNGQVENAKLEHAKLTENYNSEKSKTLRTLCENVHKHEMIGDKKSAENIKGTNILNKLKVDMKKALSEESISNKIITPHTKALMVDQLGQRRVLDVVKNAELYNKEVEKLNKTLEDDNNNNNNNNSNNSSSNNSSNNNNNNNNNNNSIEGGNVSAIRNNDNNNDIHGHDADTQTIDNSKNNTTTVCAKGEKKTVSYIDRLNGLIPFFSIK